MSTALNADTSTIEHLDFEPQEPCDNWDWSGCQKNATWRATHTCCGDTYPLCGPCKEDAERFLAHGSCRCKTCGAPNLVYPDCIRFTPIKGSGK